jgi:hypothetical protein
MKFINLYKDNDFESNNVFIFKIGKIVKDWIFKIKIDVFNWILCIHFENTSKCQVFKKIFSRNFGSLDKEVDDHTINQCIHFQNAWTK